MNSISKAAALILTVMASSLTASSITYDLTDITSTDGAIVGGTVTYDTVSATVTAASVTVTDAATGITSPILFSNLLYYMNAGGTVFQLALAQVGVAGCGDCVILDTPTPLGAATVAIDPSPSPGGDSPSIVTPFHSDPITGGTLVALSTAVPEPGTAAIVLLGLTGLIVGNRYRKS